MSILNSRVPMISKEQSEISLLRKDIERVEYTVRKDIERVEHTVRKDIERIEQNVNELKGEISAVRSELKEEISSVKSELKDEIKDVRAGQRWLIGITITGIGLIIALLTIALDFWHLPL